MRAIAGLILCLVVGVAPAGAQYSPAKEVYVDRVMVPFQAFAKDQIEGPLTTSLNQFEAKLQRDLPELYAQHQDEVRQMLRGLIVTSIETFMAEIRIIFLDILTTDELARFAERIEGEDWRMSDLSTLEKWPEVSKRIAEARQVHQRGIVLILSQTVIPRMRELGFYREKQN